MSNDLLPSSDSEQAIAIKCASISLSNFLGVAVRGRGFNAASNPSSTKLCLTCSMVLILVSSAILIA